MNKQVKQRWIEALRSGEYQQTKSCLHNDQGFCCLGVLTDLYVKDHSQHSWVLYDDRYKMIDETAILPTQVREWSGLNGGNPLINDENKQPTSLAELNDRGYTFEQIAELIEEQL